MFQLKDIEFLRFKGLIYNEAGLVFDDSNRIVLESRINNRMRFLKMESTQEYYSFLLESSKEFSSFLDLVTTNMTSFFRNQVMLKLLTDYIIPKLIVKKKYVYDKTINIWSAGCSTGEEAYSLAMIFKEALPADMDFKVIGSDISTTSLETAKAGIYKLDKIKNIPLKYFHYLEFVGDESYAIKQNIAKKVFFNFNNLIKPNPFRDLDLIVCLNVMIYFDDLSKEVVLKNFYNSCSEHSFLILGFSDTIENNLFSLIKTDHGNYYGKF